MDDDGGVTRRDLMRHVAAGSVVVALAPATAWSQQTATASVTGRVFDAEHDDHPGVPGVLVTNGRDVAVTGSDGSYSLPVTDGTIVSVVKPAGWMTPVEPGTLLPRFFYVHQPSGSPSTLDLEYDGVPPTGPLPASVDFPLRRQEEPKSFEVVLLTDTQPETDAELDFVRDDILPALVGTKARFGLHLGDIMFDDLSLYGRHNRIMGTVGIPWYNIGGNCDLNVQAPDRRHSRETFKRVFGPPHYAFSYAEAVFVMLDDVDYLGPDPSEPHGKGKFEGRLDGEQLDFVRNLLAHVPEDKLVVVAMHIPLRTHVGDDASLHLVNGADLLELLSGRPHTLSLSGHTHTTEHHYIGAAGGFSGPGEHHHHILMAACGSFWSGPFDHRGVAVADSRDGSPNGFHMLSVNGNSYETWFVPAKEPGGRQIRVSLPNQFHVEMRRDYRPGALLQPRLPEREVHGAELVANVFDGGPKTRVTMRIGASAPLTMEPRASPDPFVEEVYARNEATKKAWVEAVPCSHLWSARLPRLAPGTYSLTVEAVNEYGRTLATRLAVEVET